MFELTSLLKKYQSKCEKSIANTLESLEGQGILSQALKYALTTNGKRFRPSLIFMLNKALQCPWTVEDIALTVEFFHTASLIADDLPCMDDDDERRGEAATHIKFGEGTALLASYALISEGYSMLSKAVLRLEAEGRIHPHTNWGHVLTLALENVCFNTGAQGIIGGQYADLHPEDLTEEGIASLLHRKTGTLFEIAFVLGWLYSGGDPQKIDLVKKASWHFGLAFQIADDFEDAHEDAGLGPSSNFVVNFGRNRSFVVLKQELELFFTQMDQLGFYTDEFKIIGAYLENKALSLKETLTT
jgi:geranylgeranyl diphosphate synthase type II